MASSGACDSIQFNFDVEILFCSTGSHTRLILSLPITPQSRNWDGGLQEYSTAESCVKAVFPEATITANRTENYPLRVVVSASMGSTNVEVWSGRQQDLFRKYATKRKQAMDTMKHNLTDLKEEFD